MFARSRIESHDPGSTEIERLLVQYRESGSAELGVDPGARTRSFGVVEAGIVVQRHPDRTALASETHLAHELLRVGLPIDPDPCDHSLARRD